MKVNRKIRAAEEVAPEVEVAPEATELLFEAEDVAELVAEVAGEPVDVTVADDGITFTVGENEFTVEAEGNEEIVESSTKILRGKSKVAASTKKRPASVKASTNSRVFRKVPSGK